jgi:hypothetical protein
MLGQQSPELGFILDESLGPMAFISLYEPIAADRYAAGSRCDGADRPLREVALR